MSLKSCTKCLISKPLDLFNKKKKAKDGLEFSCRECTCKTSKNYREKNPRLISSLKANWKSLNYDRERQNNKGYNLTRYWPELSPFQALMAYDFLLLSQDYKCKICDRHESEFKSRFHVDHCHDTGNVRGLLCFNCNVMLGNSLEKPLTLIKAAGYLVENR